MTQDARNVPRSSVRRLSRDLIVTTALAQIDGRGATGLSMRTLAQELDVEAMSLYRYVNGKEDLLEAIVRLLMRDLMTALQDASTQQWQGFLQITAHEVRRIAVEHPRAFPLVATRHPAAPWLRPPLRSVEVVEIFLSTLLAQGFTDDQAVSAYRAFSSFLLGQLLLESAVRGAETGPWRSRSTRGTPTSRPTTATPRSPTPPPSATCGLCSAKIAPRRSSKSRSNPCWTASIESCRSKPPPGLAQAIAERICAASSVPVASTINPCCTRYIANDAMLTRVRVGATNAYAPV